MPFKNLATRKPRPHSWKPQSDHQLHLVSSPRVEDPLISAIHDFLLKATNLKGLPLRDLWYVLRLEEAHFASSRYPRMQARLAPCHPGFCLIKSRASFEVGSRFPTYQSSK